MSDWLDEYEDEPKKGGAQTETEVDDRAEEEIEAEQDAYEDDGYTDSEEYAGDDAPEDKEGYAYDDADEEEAEYGQHADDEEGDYDEAEGEAGDDDEDKDGEEPDESKYIIELLDYLTEALQKPTKGSLISKPRVDVDACLTIIDNIRENIPTSISYSVRTKEKRKELLAEAKRIAENRVNAARNQANLRKEESDHEIQQAHDRAQHDVDKMLADAQKQAEEIVAKAKAKGRHLISEHAITVAAQKQAAQIVGKARRQANEMRRKAVEDSWKLLDALDKQVNGILLSVEQRKDELLPPEDE